MTRPAAERLARGADYRRGFTHLRTTRDTPVGIPEEHPWRVAAVRHDHPPTREPETVVASPVYIFATHGEAVAFLSIAARRLVGDGVHIFGREARL